MKQATIAFLFCICLTASLRAGDTVTVTGTDKSTDWTVAKLKSDLAADVTTITYTGHDGKHTSTAVPLVSVLKAAGVQAELKNPTKGTDPKARHPEMHMVVTVQGRDGFYVVLSLAELMPELGNKKVWLALDVDGKPWPDADVPMKLVVADDEKTARWVHSVQTISVTKVDPPSTQPAK
jgi:hypothetical protein